MYLPKRPRKPVPDPVLLDRGVSAVKQRNIISLEQNRESTKQPVKDTNGTVLSTSEEQNMERALSTAREQTSPRAESIHNINRRGFTY